MTKNIQVLLSKENLEDIIGIFQFMRDRDMLTFETEEHLEGFGDLEVKLTAALKKAEDNELLQN